MSELAMLRRLWPYVRPDRLILGVALVITPLATAMTLVQPYLIKRAIDDHLVAGKAEGLGLIVALFLGAAVLGYLLESAYSLALSWTGHKTVLRLREELYRRVVRTAQSYLDGQPTGRLLTRLTSDLEAVQEAFASGVVNLLLDALLIVGTLVAMLLLDAKLTASLLILAPPLLFVLGWMRRRLRTLYTEVREALADLNAFLSERLQGVEVVQLFRRESVEGRAFQRRNRRFRDAMTATNAFDALMYAVVDGASSIFIAVMLVWGSGQLGALGLPVPDEKTMTVGVLVAFIEYLGRLFRPLREMAGKIAILQRSTTALAKVLSLLDVDRPAPDGVERLPRVRGHVVIRDLRFRYADDGPWVLKGIDLEIRLGETVAVVGSTGSGKTTLLKLLERAYGGYEGSIEIDGRELDELRRDDVVRRIAGVRQDVQLFSETLRFNVGLDNPDLGPSDLESAADEMHADRVVERLGWDHRLRERGRNLSVGEGQLVTLARLMAHGPDVILLDEATASVDSVTEGLVQDAMGKIFTGKTAIVIAHRLSTVRRADRVLVLEGGRIVEEGTHRELLDRDGRYAELVRAGQAALVA